MSKIILLILLNSILILIHCSENKKKSLIGMIGLINQSNQKTPTNSQSPPTPTNANGSTIATTDAGVSNPALEVSEDEIPSFVVSSSSDETRIHPLHNLQNLPSRTTQNFKKRYSSNFDRLVPPEGSNTRIISIPMIPVMSCSSLKPVPVNPTYEGEHIQNITVWKKKSNGWEFVPGQYKCYDGTNHSTSIGSFWEKANFPFNEISNRDFSSLNKANENWLDPNSTYRILISKKLLNIQGKSFETAKISSGLLSYSKFEGEHGEDREYKWVEFNTMNSSCIKTYFDLTGQIYDYYGYYIKYKNSPDPAVNNVFYQFTPPNVNKIKYSGMNAINVQLTGPALIKKTRTEVCNQVPELCLPNVIYKNSYSFIERLDTSDEYSLANSVLLGICIKNPGKENEYIIAYSNEYDFDISTLKKNCNGIWRNHSTQLPMYDFEKTRCTTNGNDSEEGSGSGTEPVCKAARGKLDVSQGNWYVTPKEEMIHPTKANKKILISGIHTFWENQKLIYKIRGNCKSGEYFLNLTAKNIYGPLPADFKSFQVQVRNNRDGKVYNLEIAASDIQYNSSKLKIFIDKGDSDLEIYWLNDAYQKDQFDVNIQIKSLSLKLIPTKD